MRFKLALRQRLPMISNLLRRLAVCLPRAPAPLLPSTVTETRKPISCTRFSNYVGHSQACLVHYLAPCVNVHYLSPTFTSERWSVFHASMEASGQRHLSYSFLSAAGAYGSEGAF